jgi:hypothetical protein
MHGAHASRSPGPFSALGPQPLYSRSAAMRICRVARSRSVCKAAEREATNTHVATLLGAGAATLLLASNCEGVAAAVEAASSDAVTAAGPGSVLQVPQRCMLNIACQRRHALRAPFTRSLSLLRYFADSAGICRREWASRGACVCGSVCGLHSAVCARLRAHAGRRSHLWCAQCRWQQRLTLPEVRQLAQRSRQPHC